MFNGLFDIKYYDDRLIIVKLGNNFDKEKIKRMIGRSEYKIRFY